MSRSCWPRWIFVSWSIQNLHPSCTCIFHPIIFFVAETSGGVYGLQKTSPGYETQNIRILWTQISGQRWTWDFRERLFALRVHLSSKYSMHHIKSNNGWVKANWATKKFCFKNGQFLFQSQVYSLTSPCWPLRAKKKHQKLRISANFWS